MTAISDEQLYAHATRAKNRVVIITGMFDIRFGDILNILCDLQGEAVALVVRQLYCSESTGEHDQHYLKPVAILIQYKARRLSLVIWM